MKKFFMIIALLALLIPSISLATTAITCTEIPNIIGSGPATELVLKCTGDQDTTVTIASSMDANYCLGRKLVEVLTYPTAGGTGPTDATDMTLVMNGLDILGGKGTNLIDNSTTEQTFAYSLDTGLYYYPVIDSILTMAISNQAAAAGAWTIKLKFEPVN